MILVVGATAHFGRQTVDSLLAAGHQVRALTRDPARAGLPEGAQVVAGDLTRPETLPPALAGVTGIFLVLPYGMDPAPLLRAAEQAGVPRIVYLSSGAVVDGAERQPDVIAGYHHDVEQAIVATGARWTFLRIYFPAVNSLSFAMQLRDGDVVLGPYAAATSAPVHEDDVADAAARVLADDGHASRTYHLTGPASMTQAEQVRILGEVLGRPLVFEELDPEPIRDELAQFLDPGFVNALFDLMAATTAEPAPVTSAVHDLTGHPARGYARWAADHAADFG